jgi:hypothetical protein
VRIRYENLSSPNLPTSPPNPARTRVACRKACNVLAMMPIPKHTPTEIRTVATGKEIPVQDTEYFTEVSSPLEQTQSKLTAFYLGGSGYQPMTIASVGLTREELPSSANGPHKQLFGLLSNGCGRLLVTLDMIYTGIFKKVSHNKRQGQRNSKRQPQRHTQRRRRRPHKWHEK